jgi:hypothetical protein
MKISVNSTFSYIKFNLNYGSVLQCFALQKVLRDRGHDVTLLRDYRANPKYILKRLVNVRYVHAFFAKAKAQVQLQGFIRRNIVLSDRAYFSYSSLKKHCPDAQCHIAGSDQIWHNANNFRYLTYVPDDQLKLSYAASFGKAAISDGMKETIKPYLSRLNGITVRERSGVDIVSSMGFSAQQVLDPTLLLDWEQYPAKENDRHGYCYCYFLNLPEKKNVCFDQIKEFTKQSGRELIVTAPLNYPLFLDEPNLKFPSVEEWLGLYKNADCIFTNTYHGLLFCIIFKKQFLFFVQQGKSVAENERFYSLLSMLQLSDRIVSEADQSKMAEKMNTAIDYEKVYAVIKEKRQETDAFFAGFGL